MIKEIVFITIFKNQVISVKTNCKLKVIKFV